MGTCSRNINNKISWEKQIGRFLPISIFQKQHFLFKSMEIGIIEGAIAFKSKHFWPLQEKNKTKAINK